MPRSKLMVRVRCLGPGEEHTFSSANKYHRVCLRCTRALEKVQGSTLFDFVACADRERPERDKYYTR